MLSPLKRKALISLHFGVAQPTGADFPPYSGNVRSRSEPRPESKCLFKTAGYAAAAVVPHTARRRNGANCQKVNIFVINMAFLLQCRQKQANPFGPQGARDGISRRK